MRRDAASAGARGRAPSRVPEGGSMIIEARGDVVTLRGRLARNQWQNIKAAANHLLENHPHGIILDCSHIEAATEQGIETFVDARLDIEAQGARIMLAGVPRFVLEGMRAVPGAS